MSSIVKSVGKVFKKVTSVVKKVAPVVATAAAVYFAPQLISMIGSGASTLGESASAIAAQALDRISPSAGKDGGSGGLWENFKSSLGTSSGALLPSMALLWMKQDHERSMYQREAERLDNQLAARQANHNVNRPGLSLGGLPSSIAGGQELSGELGQISRPQPQNAWSYPRPMGRYVPGASLRGGFG